MTTASEVKTWMRPLLQRRDDIVLVGRNLVVAPVKHIVRGIYFDASWDKNLCRPVWYVNKLCSFHDEQSGLWFENSGWLPLKRTHEQGFLEDVVSQTEAALNLDFSRVLTIEDFLARTDPVTLNGFGKLHRSLSSRPPHYATVLAALGRIGEAHDVLALAIEGIERSRLARLDRADLEFSRRTNSAIAKLDVEYADHDLGTIEKLRPLLTVLKSGDRAAIGALLREWERRTVKGWKLEQLWEPSAFPVELGAGD
jgi:hypothetical protein